MNSDKLHWSVKNKEFTKGLHGLENHNNLFHTIKLCCRGDQEYMKGIPATVDRGLMAMA